VAELIAAAAHGRGIATRVVAPDDVTRRHADRHLRLHDGALHEAGAAPAAPDVER
jgi:hypothetical protein